MALNPGTKLGPYEILAAIGAGGMGEVYRARDTRLGREVAIKLLASHLSSEKDRERFQREARVISSLSHSHICALYDIGKHQEQDFLVMELLQGESLADRLQKGALPLRQTMEYGAQIAEALECAHRAGVVHRDLKPGNVMLTTSGVKLLDFGLAKPAAATSVAAAVETPTMSRPLTAEGVIVGTYQYMSPEQVEGKEADARSDVFALGAVLYEMTTGRRAFTGKTHVSIMSAIMEKDPEPMSAVQPLTPPALEHAVATAMAKEPNERWQSAADLGRELRWIGQGASSSAGRALTARKGKPYARWAALAGAIIVAAALGFLARPATPTAPIAANLNIPGQMFEEGSFALSPDGKKLAYIANDEQGRYVLWVRSLDSTKAQPLEGTLLGEYPFWSADSKSIGFFADQKLKRVDVGGQNVQVVCDAVNGRGGTWNRDGVILFAPNAQGGLARVDASGGAPAPVTKSSGLVSHRFPQFLPDGKHFLFVVENGKNGEDGIYTGSMDSADIKQIAAGTISRPEYADGFLFGVRDGNLMAQPFDAGALHATGEQQRAGESVRWAADRRTADFSVANGTVAFAHATEAGQRLVWFDRDGKQLGTAVADVGVPTSGLLEGQLSPSGDRAAVVKRRGTGSDIWIYDLKTGLGTRLTFSDNLNESPVWSADGSKVIFSHNLIDHYELRLKPVSGAGEEQVLASAPDNTLPGSTSPDGRYLFYIGNVFSSKVQGMALPLEGDHKAFNAVQSAGNVWFASFSPDGKWLAYISDESGRSELYVTTFPGHEGKWQVSTDGAVPLSGSFWTGAGKNLEVIYVDLQFHMFAVPVQMEGTSLSVGAPKMLLGGRSLASSQFIDVTRDGKRILLGVPQENANTPLTLLLNWTQELNK